MDDEKLKRIFFEVLRVIAAIVVLYCIWQVVKTQVLYFQEDGPRFGVPLRVGCRRCAEPRRLSERFRREITQKAPNPIQNVREQFI
ncbi:hypothetical protein [Dakarella massiliensis]|uniref:hypothetical protein n=1 Tax=Dakarella massiliensis TaxID=1506471 RepID=UPI000670E8B3|nr:hypothetical protein [Dakarella massiliensis]